ncbi:hypothetical protein LILAB_15065 [Corallococcus macrosporus]|uniref:Iminophenyl-pyruvate dimer synthase domain-containing protein n=1 Tax=Myxococcus fulvus (strain ATCC BAA-855 / HW-1) TaxID=483219 RepID=F8CFU9_MYXFH|nr:hypothetical protein LILAB_15065 [Corallococcus macrosporus]
MTTAQDTVPRDPSLIPTDAAALRALAQAAVNVELFTIPLYMAGMYSIQGMHEINAAEQTFYKGRRWPGAATTSAPGNANERAFNILFSVFIQEMLHLQLAANLATGMGVKPDFTSSTLQTPQFGWTCYGPDRTVIPHIIDLRDTTTYTDVKVQLGALDANLLDLFLAIEEPGTQPSSASSLARARSTSQACPSPAGRQTRRSRSSPCSGPSARCTVAWSSTCSSATPMARPCGSTSTHRARSSGTSSTPAAADTPGPNTAASPRCCPTPPRKRPWSQPST